MKKVRECTYHCEGDHADPVFLLVLPGDQPFGPPAECPGCERQVMARSVVVFALTDKEFYQRFPERQSTEDRRKKTGQLVAHVHHTKVYNGQ